MPRASVFPFTLTEHSVAARQAAVDPFANDIGCRINECPPRKAPQSASPHSGRGKILEPHHPHSPRPRGKILEVLLRAQCNHGFSFLLPFFKNLKGKLPGERMAEFPTFWACAEHPNCRKCFRIAVNCWRIASRIAGERKAEFPTFWGHAQNSRIAEKCFRRAGNCWRIATRIAGGRVAEF